MYTFNVFAIVGFNQVKLGTVNADSAKQALRRAKRLYAHANIQSVSL